jgi:hypothetical protein
MRATRTPDGHVTITMREEGYTRLMSLVELVELHAEDDPTVIRNQAQRGLEDLEAALRSVKPSWPTCCYVNGHATWCSQRPMTPQEEMDACDAIGEHFGLKAKQRRRLGQSAELRAALNAARRQAWATVSELLRAADVI